MDINLPSYDGFYWCGQIRQISQIPIIYISSRGEDSDKLMGIAQGGDDYVEKPFRLEILRAKMEAVLRRRMISSPQAAFSFPRSLHTSVVRLPSERYAAASSGGGRDRRADGEV